MLSAVAPYRWSPECSARFTVSDKRTSFLNRSESFIAQAHALGLSFIVLDRCINGLNFNMFFNNVNKLTLFIRL
jgi:hypothetical protein